MGFMGDLPPVSAGGDHNGPGKNRMALPDGNGGGIGDLAITYGYQRFDAFATLTTALVLIVIVQLIQTLGTRLARRLRRE